MKTESKSRDMQRWTEQISKFNKDWFESVPGFRNPIPQSGPRNPVPEIRSPKSGPRNPVPEPVFEVRPWLPQGQPKTLRGDDLVTEL